MAYTIPEDKLQHLFENEDFAAKMQDCADTDALFDLFVRYELVSTREQFDAYMEEAKASADLEDSAEGELSEDDLEMVAGGANVKKAQQYAKKGNTHLKKKQYKSAAVSYCVAIYYLVSPFAR